MGEDPTPNILCDALESDDSSVDWFLGSLGLITSVLNKCGSVYLAPVPRHTMQQHGYPLSSGLSELGRNWRMNDGPVGDGSYGDDLLNQSSGDPPDAAGLAPVETKRVLVQVRSEVLAACTSVIGAE